MSSYAAIAQQMAALQAQLAQLQASQQKAKTSKPRIHRSAEEKLRIVGRVLNGERATDVAKDENIVDSQISVWKARALRAFDRPATNA